MKDNDAWAAGIIEGEGYFDLNVDKRYPSYKQAQLAVAMTDEDIVQRLCAMYGGKVRSKGIPTNSTFVHCKELFEWRLTSFTQIHEVLTRIRPWLGHRRKARCDEMIMYMLSRPSMKYLIE